MVCEVMWTSFYIRGHRNFDKDQPNTKLNHAKNPLEMSSRPITRDRAKKLKETLNGLA